MQGHWATLLNYLLCTGTMSVNNITIFWITKYSMEKRSLMTSHCWNYLLWTRTLPSDVDCLHERAALTKWRKSAPIGRPPSGHRGKTSWVTNRSPLRDLRRQIWNKIEIHGVTSWVVVPSPGYAYPQGYKRSPIAWLSSV